MWKSFLEVVRFILTKYDPVSSHGDPIRAKSYLFLTHLGCKSCPWMQVLSLDASLAPGCKSCRRVQVLSLDGSCAPGCKSCHWTQVLSLDSSPVIRDKSCRRVKVGRARNTPLFGAWGNLAAEAGGIG